MAVRLMPADCVYRSCPPGVVPTQSQYWLTPVPALQPKVAEAPGRSDPGDGVVSTAACADVPPTQFRLCTARSTRMRGLVIVPLGRLSMTGVPVALKALAI